MAREQEHLSTADIAAASDAQRQDRAARPQAASADSGNGSGSGEHLTPLFDDELTQDMRGHWSQIQSGFVDDPHRAVREADELVAQALQDLARSFARHREQIEADAKAGDAQPSTENLRIALRRYRSFFERLLSL